MSKFVCTVCGYIAEGAAPEFCPVCKAPKDKSAFAGCRSLNSVNMGPECVPEPGDHTPFTGPGYPRPNEFMRVFTVPGAPGDKLAEALGLETVYADRGIT